MPGDPLHRNRLESLGELAASLAHELNQPLNLIRMACENLDLHLAGRDPVAKAKLAKIVDQVERASRIIESVGTFSKVDRRLIERYNVEDVLDRVDALMAKPLSKEGILLVIEADDDQPFLEGNPILLDQLLFNLVINARDAILERRKTDEGRGRPDEIRIAIQWAGRPHLSIIVEDNGTGLNDLDPEAIFEPFFTTKGANGGSGLGLAVCRKVVANLAGTIAYSPGANGGARFTVDIPVPPQRANEAQGAASRRR